jgi:hypothetical protein
MCQRVAACLLFLDLPRCSKVFCHEVSLCLIGVPRKKEKKAKEGDAAVCVPVRLLGAQGNLRCSRSAGSRETRCAQTIARPFPAARGLWRDEIAGEWWSGKRGHAAVAEEAAATMTTGLAPALA